MSQIVNISDLAKNRENRKNAPKDKQNKPKTDEVVYSTDAKFITLDGIEVGFGGAFQRDFLKNLEEKREQVIQKVMGLYDKELELLKYEQSVTAESFIQYRVGFAVLKAVAMGVISNLKTGEQFDAIFDNRTDELAIISEIVLAVMHLTYTEFDYQRMLRDRWFNLDSTLTEFLESLEDLFNMDVLQNKPE